MVYVMPLTLGRGELLKLGCKQSEIDKAAFGRYKDNLLLVLLLFMWMIF